MTKREHNSMVAMKRMYDAFHELPLSLRAEINGKLDAPLGELSKAIKEYSSEVRSEIESGIIKGKVNYRFVEKV